MSLQMLLEWSRLFGETYTTEDKSLFFYSLLKMQKPERVLELGVGMGVSSFFMAQAMKENGAGRLFALDDGSGWAEFRSWIVDRLLASERFRPLVDEALAAARGHEGANEFFPVMRALADRLGGLGEHLELLAGNLGIDDTGSLSDEEREFLAPALAAPIDLVFADVGHRPEQCLAILKKLLPHLAESSSVFLDSASTFLPSHLALEQTVAQLNQGKVPAFFLAQTTEDDRRRWVELVATRRFTLMHLTERKDRKGNSMAWLKIEPCNIFPYPLTAMRGLGQKAETLLPRETVEQFFEKE